MSDRIIGQDRTIGQLVADASHDLSQLLRSEVALAKAELKDEAKQGANGLAGFSAGSGWGLTLCIIAGLLMLITSVISALRD